MRGERDCSSDLPTETGNIRVVFYPVLTQLSIKTVLRSKDEFSIYFVIVEGYVFISRFSYRKETTQLTYPSKKVVLKKKSYCYKEMGKLVDLFKINEAILIVQS